MNLEARCDIAWWQRFLPTWNGRAIIPDPHWSRSPDLALFTDASGTLGYCIYYSGHWIADTWPPPLQGRSIQWKELYPVALAYLLWGHSWLGKKTFFTATIRQWLISGLLALPETPTSCTLSASYFSVVLLTISQS